MLAWEQGHYFAKIRENVVLTTPLDLSLQLTVFKKTFLQRQSHPEGEVVLL